MRSVTRAHLIAWRKHLESRKLSAFTIRRKLSAVASLFDYLCERNAVTHNPVRGVKRPRVDGNEGKTPALSDGLFRGGLDEPDEALMPAVVVPLGGPLLRLLLSYCKWAPGWGTGSPSTPPCRRKSATCRPGQADQK
jgi:integrase